MLSLARLLFETAHNAVACVFWSVVSSLTWPRPGAVYSSSLHLRRFCGWEGSRVTIKTHHVSCLLMGWRKGVAARRDTHLLSVLHAHRLQALARRGVTLVTGHGSTTVVASAISFPRLAHTYHVGINRFVTMESILAPFSSTSSAFSCYLARIPLPRPAICLAVALSSSR